jgi:hypothetical protein
MDDRRGTADDECPVAFEEIDGHFGKRSGRSVLIACPAS